MCRHYTGDTMAFTTTDLSNIDQAIATGELLVEVDGRKVVYRSIADLKTARALIVDQIAAAQRTATGTQRSAYRFTFSTQRGD